MNTARVVLLAALASPLLTTALAREHQDLPGQETIAGLSGRRTRPHTICPQGFQELKILGLMEKFVDTLSHDGSYLMHGFKRFKLGLSQSLQIVERLRQDL